MFRRLFGRTSESRSSSAGTTAADADANRASSVDGCGSNSSEKETHTLSRPELSDMQLQRLPIRVGSGGTVSVFGRRARRSDHTFSKALVVSRLPLPCIHIGSSQLVYYEVEVIPTFSSQWVGSLCLGVTLTPLPSSQDAQLRFKEDEAATPSEAQAQQPCEEIDEELYQEELRLDELAAAEFDDAAPDKRFEAVLSDTFMVHPYSYLLTSNYNSAMVGELYCLDATGTASDASASRQRVERYAEMIVAPSTAGARGIGIGVDLATHRMHIWPPGTTSSAASVSLPLPTGVHQPRFYAAIEVYGKTREISVNIVKHGVYEWTPARHPQTPPPFQQLVFTVLLLGAIESVYSPECPWYLLPNELRFQIFAQMYHDWSHSRRR